MEEIGLLPEATRVLTLITIVPMEVFVPECTTRIIRPSRLSHHLSNKTVRVMALSVACSCHIFLSI